MTENTNNPPVETHRDGAVSAKIWRNHTNEGDAFYSVTFQRTYTDPQTEKPRESSSFQGTDLLKIQQLAGEAYKSVSHHRALDREEAKDLAAERDAAMAQAEPEQGRQSHSRSRSRGER
ncbi:MAG: hypothetical protein MRY74_00360 [Neomegalonema sp.]|nr:hypothetical protein [Neomegalonema sp.]